MENKEIIMNCGKDLFYAKGYNSVGIQEIVDKSGITKPTLYYYFGSKLGLLESIIELHFNKWLGQLNVALSNPSDLPLTLEKVATAYITFAIEDTKFYYLMMSLMYTAKENEAYKVVKPYLMQQKDLFVKIFEQARNQLGNMNGRELQFANSFHGILSEYAISYLESSDLNHIQPVNQHNVYLLVHQFMHGIYS